MKLILKSLKQISYDMNIDDSNMLVEQFKQEIENKHGFDSKSLKLVFNGSILEDKNSLSSYNIQDQNVIMMICSKVKPKNIKEEVKSEDKPCEEKSNVDVKKADIVQSKKVNKDKKYQSELTQLVEMGFSSDQASKALEAANGNISNAIDYLYNGLPVKHQPQLSEFLDEEDDDYDGPITLDLDPEFLSNLDLNNPETIKTIASVVKIITTQDSSQLPDILMDIEETNPEIIEFIKKHEDKFKEEMEKPVNEEDLLYINNMANQSNADEASIQNQELSNDDKVVVERLMGLGFTEEECIQAYLACDKNEMMAANFLLENKFKDDMNVDCNIILIQMMKA